MWIEKNCGYETPCHIWTRGTSRDYGWDHTGRRYAHRVAWERVNGPAGHMHVHHLCGTKLCVNVDHLELISQQDHRRLHQRTNKRPSRLNREAVDDIRGSDATLQVMADKYGISKAYASLVRRGLAPEDFLLENPEPAWARGRSKPPRQKTRLSPEDIEFIRTSGATLAYMSDVFGLSIPYLSMIKNRRVLND